MIVVLGAETRKIRYASIANFLAIVAFVTIGVNFNILQDEFPFMLVAWFFIEFGLASWNMKTIHKKDPKRIIFNDETDHDPLGDDLWLMTNNSIPGDPDMLSDWVLNK